MAVGIKDLVAANFDLSEEKLKKLEAAVDKRIIEYGKTKKRWFSKNIKFTARFYFSKNDEVGKTLLALIQLGAIDSFLQKYRDRGLNVHCNSDIGGNSNLKFSAILTHKAGYMVQASSLQSKREALQLLRARIIQLETAIQEEEAQEQLAESPHRGVLPIASGSE